MDVYRRSSGVRAISSKSIELGVKCHVDQAVVFPERDNRPIVRNS